MQHGFKGKTIAVIASGPSLRIEDCYKIDAAGIPSIAVNSSWRIARFAQIIFAGDFVWWKRYGKEINIPAERWTCNDQAARMYKLKLFRRKAKTTYNSGLWAIELAIFLGAKTILLLGYDAHLKGGTHWHGDHPLTKNPDQNRVKKWIRQYEKTNFGNAQIINCSPGSAITKFTKMKLGEALETFVP